MSAHDHFYLYTIPAEIIESAAGFSIKIENLIENTTNLTEKAAPLQSVPPKLSRKIL